MSNTDSGSCDGEKAWMQSTDESTCDARGKHNGRLDFLALAADTFSEPNVLRLECLLSQS
jgi:hypothetical protein